MHRETRKIYMCICTEKAENIQKKNWAVVLGLIMRRMGLGLKGRTGLIYSIFYSVPFGSFVKTKFNLCSLRKETRLERNVPRCSQ